MVDLQLRIVVAVPRSGSTLLMRIACEAPSCAVTSRLVAQGNYSSYKTFTPDYSIFSSPFSHTVFRQAMEKGCSTLISKEEFGHDPKKGECDYVIIPTEEAYQRTKPAFLFRDPIRVYDSWKKLGWTDIEGLVTAYTTLHLMHMTHPSTHAIIYEELIAKPEQTVRALCKHWDIGFCESMLSFEHSFSDFLYNSKREERIYTVENPLGLFDTIQESTSIEAQPAHNLISVGEIEHLELTIGKRYIDTYSGRSPKMVIPHSNKAADFVLCLRTKTWFSFDLDDTLHEFRKASSAATETSLTFISYLHPASSLEELKTTYATILADKTSQAFTNGKTSTEYRKERFASLLEAHNITYTASFLDKLAMLYKQGLKQNLQLTAGALHLLQYLKSRAKKVMIISEGPLDAQEWTMESLGLTPFVDVLVTSNDMGLSKVDGLFGAVLAKHKIREDDMVFVGDNAVRDIEAARAAGIEAVLYAEGSNCRLKRGEASINSLLKIKHLIDDSEDAA
ncbi:MAG: hypothetical protein M1835_003197 [Candelina submexicana]|nr:MAG: hypothetical protein M1835_003197 [Candelina submexicana]